MRFLFFTMALFSAVTASAYEPVLMNPGSPFELYTIEDIEQETWFVGTLNDFPHTFEFNLNESQTLSAQAMVLEDVEANSYVSLIAVQEVERGVAEVMRRGAGKESWQEFQDTKSKIHFMEGQVFEAELEPGVYRLEVSNPINQGTYVLKVGIEDKESGYFDTLGDIRQLRTYLGFGTFGMIGNPYVFMPLFIAFSLGFFAWQYRKRMQKVDDNQVM